ncbi:serine-rich adhesin for platelets-like [Planococcus citri]|uniref:serine-rich adhesin for platelets-like n=1 Tax=Planococcus citri TaxID=170843 RepID=UPI0031F99727
MINFVIALEWTLLVITLTQVNADDTHGIERRATNSDTTKKIVCYYTNWSVYRPGTAKFSPQNINPYLCTHLIYAFGGLDKENGLRPYDKYQDIEQGGYAKFTGLKTYNKNLKTMLAIGGWNEGSAKFSSLVADEERRGIFVKNVVKFLRQNNFDGLDLDWEYPAFRDGSKSEDKENYASLVKELREEFERESSKTGRSRLLLTMAVPAGVEYIDKGYDVPKLNKYLDFMNILSYDYHSAYEPNVNHHSPLYSLQEESEYNFDAQLTIDHTVNHYLKKGVDREKLVLGIPTYGRSYTLFNADSTDLGSPADGPGEQGEATREKGYLAYYEICANLENDKEWKIIQPKKSAMGPYAYRGNQWVSYDDADIVKLKAKYVNEKGLGGIMYWSIDNDDFRGKCHGKPYPLIEAGKESLFASGGSSANVITTSEEKRPSKLSNKRNRPKSQTLSSTSTTTKQPPTTSATTTYNALSTPEPPTTPDPGTDFVCKDEGFFPHPRDCKKYFWCLDSGPSNLGIVAHQFTCPSGLMFNKAADSCDYSRNVICNKKSEKSSTTTTTTSKPTSTSSSPTSKIGTKITAKTTTSTTTSTTTTTEPPPSLEEEYEDGEDVDSQEDPKAIKQLITLIKKLGGIAELEKQLKLEDGSTEVTTPAISKNLYNKVFSSPTSTRFKSQYRNGPSSPQHETASSNDDVPYYRKEKPQYVTIQRSRPLKNVPQDAEDSGTTNNKSVEPGKYQDTAEYTDDAAEGEITTIKYSSPPRFRSGADSRGSSPKYVTLERNRSDRTSTTTAADDESKPESSITTQRYITLVRHRPTPVTEYEEINTEPSSTQRTSTQSRLQTESPITERFKDKVSETETTTNLPVTSAQLNTDQVQQTLVTTLENLDFTTLVPKTYLVFSKKVDQTETSSTNTSTETQRRRDDDSSLVDLTTLPTTTTDYVTEPFILSTSTSVITTIRESATEKTRISLKRYKEYLKSNKTDLLNELRSNDINAENPKPINTQEETFVSKTDSTTKKSATYFRKRFNHTVTTTDTPVKTQNSETTGTHSRFFLRRHKNISSIAATSTEQNSVGFTGLPNSSEKFTKSSSAESQSENNEADKLSKTDKGRYKVKYRSSTTPESDSISSFFTRRRYSKTDKYKLTESTSTTAAPTTSKASRYFSRNRKASQRTTESVSEQPSKNDENQKVTQPTEILNSDENRYEIPQTSTFRPTSPSNVVSTSDDDSIAIATVFDSTSKTILATKEDEGIASNTDSPQIGSETSTVAMQDLTSRGKEDVVSAQTSNTTSVTAPLVKNVTEIREPIKAFRNNSRFLKNPEPEYVGVGVRTKGTRIQSSTNQNKPENSADDKRHRFGTPIRVAPVIPNDKFKHPIENDVQSSSINSIRRGRKKFSDSSDDAANVASVISETSTNAENLRKDYRSRSQSRFHPADIPQVTSTPSRHEPTRRGRPLSSTSSTSSTFSDSDAGRFVSVSEFASTFGRSASTSPVTFSSATAAGTERNEIRGRFAHENKSAARVHSQSTVTPSYFEILEQEFRERSRPAVTAIPTDPFIVKKTEGRPRFYQPSSRTVVELTTSGDLRVSLNKELDSRRRSKSQRFNASDSPTQWNESDNKVAATDVENNKPRTTVTRNRGTIKAQNSLSRTEIRELTSLINSQGQPETRSKKKPTPIVEETFVTNANAFQYGGLEDEAYTATAASPSILERSFEETTDTIYVLDGNSNSISNFESNNLDLHRYKSKTPAEIFGASETRYTNQRPAAGTTTASRITTDDDEDDKSTEQGVNEPSAVSSNERTTIRHQSEPSSRYRENFRRTTSPRSRSRSTTTTTTTERASSSSSNESSKLANRFRRRKIKPENRSISSSRGETSYSSNYLVETSTTKPKRIDISQRGSTTISDFLPVPAPLLYRGNATSNGLDVPYVEDLEAQNINTQTNYYNTEDVSDLADPAVVAIHNLKTVPPAAASQQVAFSKTMSSVAPQIAYTEDISLRPFPRIPTTPATPVIAISNPRSSIRRGTSRLSVKTTTTTQVPSLQDIYNDYHETDIEYHADPVEIPITGKVRIHSDGYIECLDMGNFPHPFSCKKFISCAKMEFDSLLGWEYTCPKGLSFDPIGGICNWAAGLGCKE